MWASQYTTSVVAMVSVMSAAVSPRLAPTARAAVATMVPYSKLPGSIRDAQRSTTACPATGLPRSVTGLTLGGGPGGLGEALVRFDVALAGGLADVRRDGRAGSGPVPVDGLGPVADDLLVERVLRTPRLPRLGGP